jgi:ferrous iron transport protein B
MTLKDLKQGEKATILQVNGPVAFRKRMAELGFMKGRPVTVVKMAAFRGPIEFGIMNYKISLRPSEAALIDVAGPGNHEMQHTFGQQTNGHGVEYGIEEKVTPPARKGDTLRVALVGNPNSGKTTLFNFASGSKEYVGNFPGKTVTPKSIAFRYGGYDILMEDLPGTYSLDATTPEELFVRNYLLNKKPDIIINVVDASNLERNLYLTTQLIDMGIKMVIALNMHDELRARGDKLDYKSLGRMLGFPIIPTTGFRNRGVRELLDGVLAVHEDRYPGLRRGYVDHGQPIEDSIENITRLISAGKETACAASPRWCSISLLGQDKWSEELLTGMTNGPDVARQVGREIRKLESQYNEDTRTLIVEAKYGFIAGALRETLTTNYLKRRHRTETEVIDTFLTHRVFGYVIFAFFLWLTFEATFTVGSYPMRWLESLVGLIADITERNMSEGTFKDLLTEGIIGGVGGVIVFLPNILILFFFISLMEDTGYMSRAIFIMDRLMHKIGLHGKSFIPLVMGFGCNVPAILATRTLQNRNDRLLTMLINPFMSCNARLPVYILLAGAFFPSNPGLVIFIIYITGIMLAVFFALLFKRTLFRREEAPFVMELPPYRLPTLRSTLLHMWDKGSQYLRKMGGVILVASLLIWALGYFPRNEELIRQYENKKAAVTEACQHVMEAQTSPGKGTTAMQQHLEKELAALDAELQQIRQGQSYIGRIGRFIEPVMSPLGFDWKMSASILLGISGKEIVVSTLGVLYQVDNYDKESTQSLRERLQKEIYTTGLRAGEKVFNPVSAFAFMLFILIYFPCVAVIIAMSRESGSWKWAAFLAAYTTLTAWLVAFVIYQAGSLLFL